MLRRARYCIGYEFTPSSVHVKVGETVRLSITATDKAHGVRIKPVALGSPEGSAPGLQIISETDCVKFKKKGTGAIDFIPQSPNSYEFECCKLCGFGHGKMKDEIMSIPPEMASADSCQDFDPSLGSGIVASPHSG